MSAEKGCCDNTRQNPPSIINGMRVTGFLLFCLSVAELGIGGKVYGMLSNVKLGAWWGGILGVITGIFATVAVPHAMIITSIVFGSFGLVVAAVGSAVDGIAYLVFKSEILCGNIAQVFASYTSSGGQSVTGYYGASTNVNALANAAYCFPLYSNSVEYTLSLGTIPFQALYDCLCVDGGGGGVGNPDMNCYGYNLGSASNCGNIIDTYTPLLQASSGLCAIVSILCFIVSVIGCAAACNCVKPLDDASATAK